MSEPREQWHQIGCQLGWRVLVYDRLDSTNNKAAELSAEPANHGVVVLADEQTAGRGQHGRTWLAPPKASVLLSLLLFPPEHLRRPALLTAWAAVAVCATVQKTIGLQTRIKWPNDIFLHGRKICGILIEQGRGTVVGIGLNVQQSHEQLAAAGLAEATSLAAHCNRGLTPPARPLDTTAVARCLIGQLDEDFAHLLGGDLGTLEACWKWHLGLLGRQVLAECADGCHRGRLREIAFAGLELQQQDGSILRLSPERVQHLSAL